MSAVLMGVAADGGGSTGVGRGVGVAVGDGDGDGRALAVAVGIEPGDGAGDGGGDEAVAPAVAVETGGSFSGVAEAGRAPGAQPAPMTTRKQVASHAAARSGSLAGGLMCTWPSCWALILTLISI
jgi:hypothetical protein